MDRRLTLGLLLAIIVGHVLFAAQFAAITPYRTAGILLGQRDQNGQPMSAPDIGAPDERQHVNYVSHLASGQGFPVFNPGDPNFSETLESHQPPLYYLMSVAWAKVAGVTDFENADQGVRLRSLNVVVGAATCAGVFFLTLWGLGRADVALAATAFCGFLPMFCALSGAVNNDPLLICLCTWVVALCVRCAVEGWSWRSSLLVGALTGLALLTKTTALALLPAIAAAALVKQVKRPTLSMAGAAAALALLIVMPWWARNQKLYGDPLAIQAFNQAFQRTAQKSTIVAIAQAEDPSQNAEVAYWKDWVGWWTARSFFGTFGYMDIWLNERGTSSTGPKSPNTLYRVLLADFVLAAFGWLLSFREQTWRKTAAIQVINGVFITTVFLLFVKFNMQYFQAQGRYLMPAIGSISFGVAIGVSYLAKNKGLIALAAISVFLIAVDVYALGCLPDEFKTRTLSTRLLRPVTRAWDSVTA